MSLIVAVYVPTGIVLSGDSRTTGTMETEVPDPKDPNAKISVQTQIVLSDAAEKIFLIGDRFGIATYGDAFVNNLPIAHHIHSFALKSDVAKSPQTYAEDLLAHFRSITPAPKCGLILAAYHEDEPYVFGINIDADTVTRLNIASDTQNIFYSNCRGGDTLIVNRILSDPKFSPPFGVMPLQDAVDFSRHLIRSTIDQMRFEPRFPTVGGSIDTLVITPDKVQFLSKKELSCS